jgi:hypothetical protein
MLALFAFLSLTNRVNRFSDILHGCESKSESMTFAVKKRRFLKVSYIHILAVYCGLPFYHVD